VTLGENVHSCEIRQAVHVQPLFRIDKSQLCWFRHVSRMSHESLVKHVLLATPIESSPEVIQGSGGVIASLTFPGPVLVWSL